MYTLTSLSSNLFWWYSIGICRTCAGVNRIISCSMLVTIVTEICIHDFLFLQDTPHGCSKRLGRSGFGLTTLYWLKFTYTLWNNTRTVAHVLTSMLWHRKSGSWLYKNHWHKATLIFKHLLDDNFFTLMKPLWQPGWPTYFCLTTCNTQNVACKNHR